MGLFDAVVGAAGIGISLFSSKKQSDAAKKVSRQQAENIEKAAAENRKLSLYDASVAMEAAGNERVAMGFKLRQHLEYVNKFLGAQRTRFAKSGVVTTTGSPASVMRETIEKGIEDYQTLRYEGLKAIKQNKSLAKRYRMLADAGMRDAAAQASVVRAEGKAASSAYMLSGISTGLQQIYSLGSDQGWWG